MPAYDKTTPWASKCDNTTSLLVNTWTYDAKNGVCGFATIDCHAPLTLNSFTTANECQNFCSRISIPTAKFGIHSVS